MLVASRLLRCSSIPRSATYVRSKLLFSTSNVRFKDDDSDGHSFQKEQVLLGSSLKRSESKNNTTTEISKLTVSSQDQASPAYPHMLDQEVQRTMEKINSMTPQELKYQKFLDGDKPFLSVEPEGLQIRKNLIQDLPATIELRIQADKENKGSSKYSTDTLEGIQKIYKDLEKLDTDEAVHNKYYERFGLPVNDLVNDITQGINGINDKFKSLRRWEDSSLPLSPQQFRLEINPFRMPYNVPGYDVSLSGIPLRWGKQRETKQELPVELVKDLKMYETTVPVHKRDLDFETDRDKQLNSSNDSITIHPDIDTRAIIEKVEFREKCIEVQSLDDYKPFPTRSNKTVDVTSNLISALRRRLGSEISREYSGVLMLPDIPLKSNQFQIFEKKKPKILYLWNESGSTEISLPIQLHSLSSFPLSTYNIKTKKERLFLRMHLFKLFMINLEEHIDILIRLKYKTEKRKNDFLKKLARRIYHLIDSQLIDTVIRSTTVPSEKLDGAGALLYKPFKNGSFKRLIWTRNGWGSLKHHQRSKMPSIQVKILDLEKVVLSD
ncbi:hypothetical protein CAAN1_04S05908 [[Candida] anglica]|uniref:Ribosomal protein S24/S35 mitochondrial conserved domain-containing protein n=1 Tax=[Candida] anglica TaxID=148631 RepID=A0ABP0E8J8_9ASCO